MTKAFSEEKQQKRKQLIEQWEMALDSKSRSKSFSEVPGGLIRAFSHILLS